MADPVLDDFTARGLLIAETGTDLEAATHGAQLLDGKTTTSAQESERVLDMPFLTNSPVTLSNHTATIEGGLEIVPPTVPGHVSNGIPPAANVLYPCAMQIALNALLRTSKLTAVPTSAAMITSVGQWYHAGTLLDVDTIRGDLSGLSMEIGKPFMATGVKLQGFYEPESEAALPDIDLSEYTKPTNSTRANSTLLIDSLGDAAITDYHTWALYFRVSFGQALETIELTEHGDTSVQARKGTFEMLIARPDLDDMNPRALVRAEEHIYARWKLREADGRYSMLWCRGQITNVVDENHKGKRMMKISGRCIGTAPGTDYGIDFGDDTFALNGTISNGTEEVLYVANGLTPSGLYEGALAWDISVGALPTGLSINASTGVISGTPADGTAGTINITIRATDDTSPTPKVATKAVSFTIAA